MVELIIVGSYAARREVLRKEFTTKGLIVEEERIAVVHSPGFPVTLQSQIDRYQAIIDEIYLQLPRGGYFGNEVTRSLMVLAAAAPPKHSAGDAAKKLSRLLVENHFNLGLFGDISFRVLGEAGSPERALVLPAVRLAHIHYPDFTAGAPVPVYLDYSMDEQGTEHRDLVAELQVTAPDIILGYEPYTDGRGGPSPVLTGTGNTLEDLFKPLKLEVEDLARRRLF